MPSSRPNFFARISARLLSEERRVFTVQVAVIFVVVTLLNIGFYQQRELRELGVRHHLQSIVRGWDGLAWYVWVPAAPLMLMLIRRYPLAKETMRRNLWRFVTGSVLIYLAVTNARYLFRIIPNIWLPDSADLPISLDSYLQTISLLVPLDFLTYSGFFAASFAIDYYFMYRLRANEIQRLQLEAARLQSELARAQLASLRGQLQPHFLFNSFNAIAMLVRQRKLEPAVETITQLSGLLRMAIDHVNQPELSIAREMDFVGHYLEIERIRFGGKLQTDLKVEPKAMDCVVPGLLLQPLVENAIKHGISLRVTPGAVEVDVRQRGDRLDIAIINDGPEIAVETPLARQGGIGLTNTRSRLRNLYGSDFHLEIERQPGGRTAVRLDLPWRTEFTSAPMIAQPEVAFS